MAHMYLYISFLSKIIDYPRLPSRYIMHVLYIIHGDINPAQVIRQETLPLLEALDGGSRFHMSILRSINVALSNLRNGHVTLSILRNDHVPCHYLFKTHVAPKRPMSPCRF